MVHFLGEMRQTVQGKYNKEGYSTAVFSSVQELFSTPFSYDPGPLFFPHKPRLIALNLLVNITWWYVYFSCVSGTNKSKQHHNKIKREGDFESANQITAKNHNIGERQAPYKRSNNNLANSC